MPLLGGNMKINLVECADTLYKNLKLQGIKFNNSGLPIFPIAIRGSKVIPNFRIGLLETLPSLLSYPKDSMFCVGSLGCSRKVSDYNFTQFKTKVLYARPKKLLYYGKVLPPYKSFLDDLGIPYKAFVNDDKTIAVVCDVGGGYLRIQDLTVQTKKELYLNLDGTNGHNYKDSNGKIHGRNDSEYQKATHFRIKKREEM